MWYSGKSTGSRSKEKTRPSPSTSLSEAETGDAELREWQLALHAYRARDWDAASMSLGRLLAVNPACGLYGVYLQRIQEKRRNPPPSDWDGVTVFDEK